MWRVRLQNYLGKLKVLPQTVGDVTTIKEPVFVRQTALIAFFPNFAQSTVLHEVGLGDLVLKFLLVVLAQRAT